MPAQHQNHTPAANELKRIFVAVCDRKLGKRLPLPAPPREHTRVITVESCTNRLAIESFSGLVRHASTVLQRLNVVPRRTSLALFGSRCLARSI